jgi:hypothetical protein
VQEAVSVFWVSQECLCIRCVELPYLQPKFTVSEGCQGICSPTQPLFLVPRTSTSLLTLGSTHSLESPPGCGTRTQGAPGTQARSPVHFHSTQEHVWPSLGMSQVPTQQRHSCQALTSAEPPASASQVGSEVQRASSRPALVRDHWSGIQLAFLKTVSDLGVTLGLNT